MTLIVLGSAGQLASHLRRLRPEALFLGRAEMDLLDVAHVERRLLELKPAAIINAAAYTAVDQAEREPELAWRINCEAVAAVARAAARLDVPLVHVSTDYVFDGNADAPYRPSDPVRPLNAYGRSKLGGELAVSSLCQNHWILRTSWVFSEHGRSFVHTMLRLAAERDTLNVVSDQMGRPTYAHDLARLALALVDHALLGTAPPTGIHHVGGGPCLSWHAFACRIMDEAEQVGLISRQPEIHELTTAEYPTPAQRPLRAVLEPCHAFQAALGVMPDWQKGLVDMLEAVAEADGRCRAP